MATDSAVPGLSMLLLSNGGRILAQLSTVAPLTAAGAGLVVSFVERCGVSSIACGPSVASFHGLTLGMARAAGLRVVAVLSHGSDAPAGKTAEATAARHHGNTLGTVWGAAMRLAARALARSAGRDVERWGADPNWTAERWLHDMREELPAVVSRARDEVARLSAGACGAAGGSSAAVVRGTPEAWALAGRVLSAAPHLGSATCGAIDPDVTAAASGLPPLPVPGKATHRRGNGSSSIVAVCRGAADTSSAEARDVASKWSDAARSLGRAADSALAAATALFDAQLRREQSFTSASSGSGVPPAVNPGRRPSAGSSPRPLSGHDATASASATRAARRGPAPGRPAAAAGRPGNAPRASVSILPAIGGWMSVENEERAGPLLLSCHAVPAFPGLAQQARLAAALALGAGVLEDTDADSEAGGAGASVATGSDVVGGGADCGEAGGGGADRGEARRPYGQVAFDVATFSPWNRTVWTPPDYSVSAGFRCELVPAFQGEDGEADGGGVAICTVATGAEDGSRTANGSTAWLGEATEAASAAAALLDAGASEWSAAVRRRTTGHGHWPKSAQVSASLVSESMETPRACDKTELEPAGSGPLPRGVITGLGHLHAGSSGRDQLAAAVAASAASPLTESLPKSASYHDDGADTAMSDLAWEQPQQSRSVWAQVDHDMDVPDDKAWSSSGSDIDDDLDAGDGTGSQNDEAGEGALPSGPPSDDGSGDWAMTVQAGARI